MAKEIRNIAGHVRKVEENVEETRTIEFVASDESRDSHHTVVPVSGWDLDRFNRNGIIGYQHNVYGDLCGNEDPDRVIGTGEARIEGKELIVRITFEPADINPLAEKIFRKVLHGTLKAVSVGFVPTAEGHWGEGDEAKKGVNETYYFAGQELLEVSVVNIPSNKNALKRSVRNNTVDALNFIYRALDGEYRYSEIEGMKVGDVLGLLERKADERLGTRADEEEDPEEEKPEDEEDGADGAASSETEADDEEDTDEEEEEKEGEKSASDESEIRIAEAMLDVLTAEELLEAMG